MEELNMFYYKTNLEDIKENFQIVAEVPNLRSIRANIFAIMRSDDKLDLSSIENDLVITCKRTKEAYEDALIRLSNVCEEIGKCVFGTTDESLSRFMLTISPSWDFVKKDGWHNMFTISNKPVDAPGTYLLRIERFAMDKEGNTIMIVTPLLSINPELIPCFYYEEKMSRIYRVDDESALNTVSARSIVNMFELYNSITNGDIDNCNKMLNLASEALYSKTQKEVDLERLAASENSLIQQKIKENGLHDYYEQIDSRYWSLLYKNEISETPDIIQRALETEEYYRRLKEEKARLRKEKRLAKKEKKRE